MKSLFDIQVNGFGGVDFQSPHLTAESMELAVDALSKHQTRRFFATLITDSIPSLLAKFQNMERIRNSTTRVSKAVCGYHLEGPWISPEIGYRGAHNERHIGPPDWEDFLSLQDAAGGNIRLLTLAPEWPGSHAFIERAVASGVCVSLGHTNATSTEIDAAVSSGARFCTHLGNGVPQLLPRHDNVIQRLLAHDGLAAFFIPDGVHLPPHVLKNLFRSKPVCKAFFTSDCMSAAGAPPGCYRLGDLEIQVGIDRIAHMPDGPGFAGSVLCPDEALDNLVAWLGLTQSHARSLFSEAIASEFGIILPEL